VAALRSPSFRAALPVFAIAFVVYALTAARTITFWEGAHYSLLARTLSISNPPGSLLLTLIGRGLGDLPFAWPIAFRLNLLAATIGAAAAASVAALGMRLANEDEGARGVVIAGAVVAGLLFAFGPTPWFHATQFTPYGLSALFTAFLLLAFVAWWKRADTSDAIPGAALVALLFGLDLSVHRANVLLIPAVVAGVLLRRPGAALNPRFVGGCAAAFVAGASLQLLYIALSLREPFLDISVPDSLAKLGSFERMDVLGGGFLVDVWPRRADFLHVQLGDLASFARANLGAGSWGWLAGAALSVAGLLVLARRSPRLAVAWLLFEMVTGLGAVFYFNRPVEYFRPLDRNYLPCLVTLTPPLAIGVAALLAWTRERGGRPSLIAVALLALALPVTSAVANWRGHDLSHARFAETFARDLLEPLPPRAILVTNGDNDSFPLWYLQQVEHVRTDVAVLNFSTMYAEGGLRRARRADPSLRTLAISDTLLAELVRRTMNRRPTFVAVTVPIPIPEPVQPAGLSNRVVATPADSTASRAALERFVSERLPGANLADRRELVADDARSLPTNYVAVALQLVQRQIAEQNGAGALRTLEILARSFPAWRYPANSGALREGLGQLRAKASDLERKAGASR